MHLLASTSPPTLHISRPTPTTVSFTATTRPAASTLTAKILLYISHAVRAGLGVLILALWWAKWREFHPLHPADPNTYAGGEEGGGVGGGGWGGGRVGLEMALLTNRAGVAVQWCAAVVDWKWLVLGGVVGLWGVLRRGYTEESLLVLRGLGIQTSSSSPTYLSTATTRFIPTASIQDIFIHEAFKGFEVKFYLAIVVEGEEDAVVVFPKLLPRRQILEEVWRGARACLYEPKT